jgi:hypothetical protein
MIILVILFTIFVLLEGVGGNIPLFLTFSPLVIKPTDVICYLKPTIFAWRNV